MSFKKLQKKQQGGKMLFPPIYQRPVSDNTVISTPQQTLQQDKVNQQAAFNQLQANKKYIGKPTGKLSLAQRDAKTKQLAEEQGLQFSPSTGRTDTQFVPFSKTENTVLKAGDLAGNMIEGAGIIDGASELGSLAKQGFKKSINEGTLSELSQNSKSFYKNYLKADLPEGTQINSFNPIDLFKKKKSIPFNSEIDWGKWNKEIPENKALLDEYNNIEKITKGNNSWMKNPDGNEFKGSPEQFIQQQSNNFKKAFPNGSNISYRGDLTDLSEFKSQQELGKEALKRKYNLEDTDTEALEKLWQRNKDKLNAGIYTTDSYNAALEYSKGNPKNVKSLYTDIRNPKFSNTGESFRVLNSDKEKLLNEGYDALITKPTELYPSGENVLLRNNQLKSAIGNNGMFDMNNPNIYKGLIPPLVIGTSTALQQKQQGGFSTEGYRKNSPDVSNPYNIINSNVIGTDNMAFPIIANGRVLHPDTGDHYFPEGQVHETPLFKSGGSLHKGEASAILKQGTVYGHSLSKKQITFFKQLAKKESKHLSKKQEGGLWSTNKKAFVDSVNHDPHNVNIDFVKRFYGQNNPSIQVKGEPERSTHLMAYDPKSKRVFPEVVRQNGKLQYLGNGDAPYDYADKTGEFIQFKTPQQADWYSNNGYKIGTNVNNSINAQGIPYNNPNYVIPKRQQGGFQQLQSNINNWQTDENYQHPINYNQQTPLYKIPEENRLQNPVQITPTGKTPEPFITNKSQTDLSFAPLLVNSIAESFATRANNNRDNNYQQSNLGNPYNYLPVTNNTNSYQNYGTQVYQMGGGVDNSQDDSDFEDMADEDFLFGVDENIEQPVVQKQEVPEEVQQPVQEEEQAIIQPDMSIWDDTGDETSNITSNTGLSMSNNIRPSGNLDNDIATIESGGNYKADNSHSSAIGKYQFLYSQWGDDIKRVTGISSPEEFKNNPKAQEEFYSYYKYNHMIPAIQRLRRYNTQGLSDDALGKLFHFKGEAGAKKYLTEGIDDTHANNISIPKYIGK